MSRRLGELAALTRGTVVGDADAAIQRVASVDEADVDSLTFAVDERWLDRALRSRARAILAPAAAKDAERNGKTLIVVAQRASGAGRGFAIVCARAAKW